MLTLPQVAAFDGIWEPIAAVAAIATLIVAILALLLQRRRKDLTHWHLRVAPVLSPAAELEGTIQVLYQGNPVTGLFIGELRITNSGNVPITADDYERPIVLIFPEGVQVLNAEVADARPASLTPALTVGVSTVTVNPLLLNGGDSFLIRTLTAGSADCRPRIDGRVAGVQELRRQRPGAGAFTRLIVTGFVVSMSGFWLSLQTPPRPQRSPEAEALDSAGVALFVLGQVAVWVAFVGRQVIRVGWSEFLLGFVPRQIRYRRRREP